MADNNTLRKDLGPVTAYAIAVEAGFEGTQEEWVRRISSSVDQQSFDTLAASVESGDATLSNKIDNDIGAEAEARSAADTAEAAARSAADTAEATARETADTAQSGRIDALSETVAGNDTTLRNILVHKPADSYSPDGTNGQVLMTHGDGTTEWSSFGQPTSEQAAAAVSAWLDAHPEATTTVVDGSITKAKLDSELKDRVNLATNSLAPIFQQATANDPGTYVSIADRLYYLPEGHTADVTWENTTKVEVQTTSEIKNLSDDVSELKSAIDDIDKLLITSYSGSYKTNAAPQILCVFPCVISSGDTIKVKTSYTGSNTTLIDIRFYDGNGTIHVIKTDQPIGTDYTFVASEDYVSVSFYRGLSGAEQGKIFTANISASGEVLNEITGLTNDITNINGSITEINNQLEKFDGFSIGNLMPDVSEWITGRIYDGVYSDAITTVKCTDFIPVTGGETYYLYGGFISQNYFGVYDANKNVIPGWSFTQVTANSSNASTAVITLAQTAKYIRMDALADAMGSFPADAYISLYPNNLPKTLDMSDNVPRIKGNGTLSDKKILVIGDSISTDVYGSYKKWVTFLCEQGFFSTGFTTNNSYHATGYVATYKEEGIVKQDTFLNRVVALGDISGYDMIVTFGGINDWIQSVDFDDFKDAVDDYYSYLLEHATQARIAVISPLRTSLYGTTNSVGKTQKDYNDYIKSVATDYSFPVLNLTDNGGFCPEKSNTFRDMWTYLPTGYQIHDGVHPVAEWERKYLAPQIAWFLSNLI